MTGECYYCHGIVLPSEDDDILLDGHANHRIYMHKQCGASHDAIAQRKDGTDAVKITCPECGGVETH